MPRPFGGSCVSDVPAQPDSFDLDTKRYELRRGERVLRLEKIPMELLILLAERKDQLVGLSCLEVKIPGQRHKARVGCLGGLWW